MSVEDRLKRFIVEELRWDGPSDELDSEYPLLDNRVLDSLGIYKLVTFIENEYDVEIDDSELVPTNFGTLGGIARLIAEKRV